MSAATLTGATLLLVVAWTGAPPARAHGGEQAVAPAADSAGGRSTEFDFEAPPPGTYALPAIGPAPDGEVLDRHGEALRLHELMGERIVLLGFVYLSCRDVCPVAMARLHALHGETARDPVLRDTLALITVSFDPERDTPRAIGAYADALVRGGQGSPWRFFTSRSRDAIDPVLEAYGQPLRRRPSAHAGGADIEHLLRVYLIDRERRIRNIYGLGFLDPRLLANDVRTLLLEARPAAR